MLRMKARPVTAEPTAYVSYSPSHGLWTVNVHDTRGRVLTRMGALVDPTDDMIRAAAPGVVTIVRNH